MDSRTETTQARPWYREFWPWFVFGLVGAVVLASMVTFWHAMSSRDPLVVDEAEYDRIRGELRAQDPAEPGDERD
ncbi:MAG: FixH family protein [Gammaproteobacteria bacterium]